MTRREQLKKEVLAAVCLHLRTAKAEGKDHWREVEEAFPDLPQSFRIEACLEIDDEADEAWWDQLEKTIDGEVLRKAIGGPEAGQ